MTFSKYALIEFNRLILLLDRMLFSLICLCFNLFKGSLEFLNDFLMSETFLFALVVLALKLNYLLLHVSKKSWKKK